MDKASFLGIKPGQHRQLDFPDLQKHWHKPVVLTEAQNTHQPLRHFQKLSSNEQDIGAQRLRSMVPQPDRSSTEDIHASSQGPPYEVKSRKQGTSAGNPKAIHFKPR